MVAEDSIVEIHYNIFAAMYKSLAKLTLLVFLLCSVCTCTDSSVNADSEAGDEGDLAPHVFVALQARNSAYLLPNFFGYLENLDYPKDRISVW